MADAWRFIGLPLIRAYILKSSLSSFFLVHEFFFSFSMQTCGLMGLPQGYDSSGDDGNSVSGYSQPRLITTSGPYGPPGGGTSGSTSAPVGSGAEEERLVENVCTPGGLRAQPDREDLRLFVETAAGLSGQRIAKLLQTKIVSSVTDRFKLLRERAYQSFLRCSVGGGSDRGWDV